MKRAEIEVLGQWDIPAPGNPSAVPVSATYDVEISAQPGSVVSHNISQEIKPNSVDRFEIAVSSSHAPYPFLGIFAYLLKVRFIYNEDNKVIEAPPILMHIQTKMAIESYFRPPPSKNLLEHNKIAAEKILKSITDNTIYDADLLKAIKSWAEADISQASN